MLCTNLVVRTPKDGRGISQKQVLEQNLSSTDVHGCIVLTNALRRNQQPRRERRGCCSHKVVTVGFNTLRYDASVGVLNPPHE